MRGPCGDPATYHGGRLGSVRRVDAHILRCEVASPVARAGGAGVQIEDNRNVFGEQAVTGGAFVEIERTAAPQNRDAGHLDIDARGVERHTGTPGCRENAAPAGITSGKGRLD